MIDSAIFPKDCRVDSICTTSLLQIIPFVLGAASVDRQFMRKMKGACKSYVAILACRRT
jgi:hypothetical protein